jgi:hypothetical protein
VKEVKEEYMKPFNAFNAQASELIQMFDEPIEFICEQSAAFERKRLEEKRDKIKYLYNECIDDMSDFLPLAAIYNEKWENKTTSDSNIRKDMMERKEAAKAILGVGTDELTEKTALDMYKRTFDLAASMKYIADHEKQKQEILAAERERVKREEEERIRREEREKLEAEIKAQREKEEAVKAAEDEARAKMEEAVETAKVEAAQSVIDSLSSSGEGIPQDYFYRLTLTDEQKEKMEIYFNSVGIEYEVM